MYYTVRDIVDIQVYAVVSNTQLHIYHEWYNIDPYIIAFQVPSEKRIQSRISWIHIQNETCSEWELRAEASEFIQERMDQGIG